MSAMYEEKVKNWDAWLNQHSRGDLDLVGFEHWCGLATLVHDWPEWMDNMCCSGCGFELDGRHPEAYTPLYKVKA